MIFGISKSTLEAMLAIVESAYKEMRKKDLVVINGQSGEIICISEAKDSVHDFEMFKQSGIHMIGDILCVGDKGFQGICDFHNAVQETKRQQTDCGAKSIQQQFIKVQNQNRTRQSSAQLFQNLEVLLS